MANEPLSTPAECWLRMSRLTCALSKSFSPLAAVGASLTAWANRDAVRDRLEPEAARQRVADGQNRCHLCTARAIEHGRLRGLEAAVVRSAERSGSSDCRCGGDRGQEC